jgi:hypothetical protein
MRRNVMLVVGLAAMVGGCGIFSAHSDVVEVAAGQNLTAERLADIMTRVKAQMTYDNRAGTFVTGLWTDVTLFAQAVAANKMTTDSAFVADAMWPMIEQTIYSRWIDTIVARKGAVTTATTDSAYKADQLRVVQHILIKADSGAPKEVKDIAHRKIDAILTKIKGGASFSQMAIENSEDQGSQADSGYYGPKVKGFYMPSFDKTLWSLKPGEMSGIVTTPFGYHILRRPTMAEAGRLWRDTLSRGVVDAVSAAYEAELAKANDLKIDASAVPHMRTALDDRPAHLHDKTALATYKGGAFTTGDFIRWINAALSDPARTADQEAGLKAQPDSMFQTMVTRMSQGQLILNEARKNKVQLTKDEWKQMQDGFAVAVDTLKATVGLTGPEFDPAKTSASDRAKAAQAKVEEYFNDITSQKKVPRMLPGILAATLRERAPTKFNAVALQHGLDLAKAAHAADSAKAVGAAGGPPSGAAPEGPIKAAPGGPPVGNAAPPPAPKKP